MKFCDISTFYCATGGGSRTYYNAKIAWFAGQQEHSYTLIYPGPRFAVRQHSATVTLVQVFGARVTRDPEGYRLILDARAVARTLGQLQPDVLETGDPWIGGPLSLLLRRLHRIPPVLVSAFYHSDPIATYVQPRLGGSHAEARREGPFARNVGKAGDRLFSRVQRLYDVTLVASHVMADRLRASGVNVVVVPFGVDPVFFSIAPRCLRRPRPVRVLYAGRLDGEKEVDLLLDILPRLLEMQDVEITVAGKGSYGAAFSKTRHPRFTFAGFLRDRAAMKVLYEQHHVLLAPGRYETFGLAALEAAASGLVVVGPDAGGTGELLRQMPTPFTFEPGNSDSLLRAVESAINCDFVRAAQESRAIAVRYGTWPDAISREVAEYRSIVK